MSRKPKSVARDRDVRDLNILALIDLGATIAKAAQTYGMSRDHVAKLLGDIRKDEAGEAASHG